MNPAIDTTLAGINARPVAPVFQVGEKLPGTRQTVEQLREVAEEFESVFISEMIRPVFDSIETEAPFGGGPSEDIWRALQVDEYGKSIAKSGGIGIADAVMDQLIRLQEAG